MNIQFNTLSICALLTIMSTPLWAAEGHQHRHHDSHQHGVAEMNVAIDGNQLIIELKSPAANIVGFEHAPQDQAERKQVKQAMEQLKMADKIFQPSAAAKCIPDAAEVESELAQHDHGHQHRESIDKNSHAEFNASYTFSCQHIKQLTQMQVNLFSLFSGMEKIKTQIISPNLQELKHLSPSHNSINFK